MCLISLRVTSDNYGRTAENQESGSTSGDRPMPAPDEAAEAISELLYRQNLTARAEGQPWGERAPGALGDPNHVRT